MYVHPVHSVPYVLEYRVERHQQIATTHSSFFPSKITIIYIIFNTITLTLTSKLLYHIIRYDYTGIVL